MKRIAVAGVLALATSLAAAAPTQCTMVSLTRTVEVVETNPGEPVPCEVKYAKPTEGGDAQTLWHYDHEAGQCEAQAAQFVEQLKGWGWSCGEAAQTSAPAG